MGCPFCRTMLTDGLTHAQGQGTGENVQVHVSQLLLAAVERGDVAAPEDDEQASRGGQMISSGSTPEPNSPMR
jgi:hypothetical protein